MPQWLAKFGVTSLGPSIRSDRQARVRAALLSLGLAVGLGPGAGLAAETESAGGPHGAVACAPDPVAGVGVTYDASENLFLAADGSRYLATDLRNSGQEAGHPEPAAGDAPLRQGHLVAVPLGPPDRWGLVPAWIVEMRAGQAILWQAQKLEDGRAVFAPDHGKGACARALRAAESRARQAGRGIWARDGQGRIHSTALPESFKSASGRYIIARGRIVSLGKTSRTRYLNFGKYWKTDVTGQLTVADEDVFNAALGSAGWSLDALAGRFVEMRGIVEQKDGPLITLRHPEQLVVLEDKRAGRDGQGNN